jgi:hypothetical protein
VEEVTSASNYEEKREVPQIVACVSYEDEKYRLLGLANHSIEKAYYFTNGRCHNQGINTEKSSPFCYLTSDEPSHWHCYCCTSVDEMEEFAKRVAKQEIDELIKIYDKTVLNEDQLKESWMILLAIPAVYLPGIRRLGKEEGEDYKIIRRFRKMVIKYYLMELANIDRLFFHYVGKIYRFAENNLKKREKKKFYFK